MYVDPGELDKRIQIIAKEDSEKLSYDDDGYPITQTPKIIRSCWASFKRTSGTETVKANADFATMKCRFLVRYTSTEITRKMQVRYNGNDYNIIFVNDYNDKHEYLEIWCELVSNNG